MKAQLLYDALNLHRNDFKPTEVWDKLTYASQMLYCERSIASGSWKDMPALIVEYVETKTATKSAIESKELMEQ
jgi:hypothetical protein